LPEAKRLAIGERSIAVRESDRFCPVSDAPPIPSYKELLWPTLLAVRAMGDSGTIEEIVEKVIELEGFTEEQQAVQHGDGPATEIEYRLAWARTYLKGMGALDNSKRGVWSTTESGRLMTPSDVLPRHAEYVAQSREARKAKKAAKVADEDDPGSGAEDGAGAGDWKEQRPVCLAQRARERDELLLAHELRVPGRVGGLTLPRTTLASVTFRCATTGLRAASRLHIARSSRANRPQTKRFRPPESSDARNPARRRRT
jgi:Mrr N-terminal domain